MGEDIKILEDQREATKQMLKQQEERRQIGNTHFECPECKNPWLWWYNYCPQCGKSIYNDTYTRKEIDL